MPASAGFLEMPDISDVPELERKTLLRDMDIPAVRDRNPDPQAGPRLAVSAFRLQGMVEFPELGIAKAELDKMVEEIRVEMMAEGKLLDSGYTQDEIGEVSDLLGKIEDETMDRHVSTLEVQQLVWLVRDQRSKRGITLGQIEAIADKITTFYRERGFILAKAYIPKQEVRDGIVNLTMQLGVLGAVNALDNVMYKSAYLESSFNDTLAEPVTNNVIEERLYLINDYPGINATGYFEPGAQVGDTRLKIKVNQEHRYDATARVDNHGSDSTGSQRLYIEGSVNNALGQADQITVGVLNSYSPKNATYWLAKYRINLFSPYWKANLGAATNEFVIDQNNANLASAIDGITEQKYISLDYAISRGRQSNYSASLKYENILSDLNIGNIISISKKLDDEINNRSLTFNYDALNEADKVLHSGSITYTSGEFVIGAEAGQDAQFNILSSDYTLLTFWKLPYFESSTRIILRSSLQVTDNPLSSISQFSLGGPVRARGYALDLFSADNAVYAGLEWIFNSPDFMDYNLFADVNFGKITQPFIFFDAAYGVAKSLKVATDDSTARLFDAGLGLKFSHLGIFKGNLQFAFPVDSTLTNAGKKVVDDSMKVIFDFQYSFL